MRSERDSEDEKPIFGQDWNFKCYVVVFHKHSWHCLLFTPLFIYHQSGRLRGQTCLSCRVVGRNLLKNTLKNPSSSKRHSFYSSSTWSCKLGFGRTITDRKRGLSIVQKRTIPGPIPVPLKVQYATFLQICKQKDSSWANMTFRCNLKLYVYI